MDWRSACDCMCWKFTQCYQQHTGTCLTERICCICTMIDCMYDHTTSLEWAKTIYFQLLRHTDKNFVYTLAHKCRGTFKIHGVGHSRWPSLPCCPSSFSLKVCTFYISAICPWADAYVSGIYWVKWDATAHVKCICYPRPTLASPDKYKHMGRTDDVVITRIQIGHMKSNNSKNVTKDKHKYQWNC